MPESDEGLCPTCKHPVYEEIKHDCAAWSRQPGAGGMSPRTGTILRLCAEVVRGAAGLDDDDAPVLPMGAEEARILALAARDEMDRLRAQVDGLVSLVLRMYSDADDWHGSAASSHVRSDISDAIERWTGKRP